MYVFPFEAKIHFTMINFDGDGYGVGHGERLCKEALKIQQITRDADVIADAQRDHIAI